MNGEKYWQFFKNKYGSCSKVINNDFYDIFLKELKYEIFYRLLFIYAYIIIRIINTFYTIIYS